MYSEDEVIHPNGSDLEGFVVDDDDIDYERIDGVNFLDLLTFDEEDEEFHEEEEFY
jgi:hypothetical protein